MVCYGFLATTVSHGWVSVMINKSPRGSVNGIASLEVTVVAASGALVLGNKGPVPLCDTNEQPPS
jgi:hypothetical protein